MPQVNMDKLSNNSRVDAKRLDSLWPEICDTHRTIKRFMNELVFSKNSGSVTFATDRKLIKRSLPTNYWTNTESSLGDTR